MSICVMHPFIIFLEQYIFRVTSLIPILFYNQFNQPECMLMAHLLSAVFKEVVMLSESSIHFRQKLINLISYVKRGDHRAMSECSKYQLLAQTDYIRLREKYDHLYIYSYILSYISAIFEATDYCPVEWYDGCCKVIAGCETVVDRNSTDFTVKCENCCPVECSDGCCKTIAACETVIDRNSTGFCC